MPERNTNPLGDVRAAAGNYQQLAPELEKAIFDSGEKQRQYSQYQAAATVGAADATARAANLQAESVIAEQTMQRQLLRAVGLDVEDPNSALREEMLREQTARRSRETVDQEILQLESINFFQNPLGFLMAQPQLQQKTAQYNNLARQENTASAEIARMQSLATTIKAVTPAKDADLIRQKAAADADAVVKQAEAAAAQINAQNAAGHAKNLLDAFTLKRNMFADILQMRSLEEAIADRRWRMAESAKHEAERLAMKKEQRDQEVAIVTGINTYRRAISGNAAPDLTLQDIKNMPTDIREQWYQVMLRGNYGNTYSQSVPFIGTYGNQGEAANSGNAAMMANVRLLREKALDRAKVIQDAYRGANMGKSMKDADALTQAYEELYKEDTTFAVKGNDKSRLPISSPYSFDWDKLAIQAASTPAARGTNTITDVLVQAKSRNPGANLTAIYTPVMFLNDVNARVVSGQVDPAQAAREVSLFFSTQTNNVYEDGGLRYFALPRFQDYTVTTGAKGNNKVDMMNPTQLENYFTSQVANHRRVQNMNILHRGLEGVMNPEKK